MKKLAWVFLVALTLSGCASVDKFLTPPRPAVSIGMTEADFLALKESRLYRPNVTVSASGRSVQYVAVSDIITPRYIYFDGGVLTVWQER